ncbi:hypothetical protein ABT56_01295 [Photobacterium aquae]|uniref:Nudix hydrolase domain-containing protein n=1 Tax=Photobacterium aquae TaxID=1195763 RepID=A0A0J1HCE4_9GAMM|nr:hypothetical protein ABT56_01295 [Photobacterium aquae]
MSGQISANPKLESSIKLPKHIVGSVCVIRHQDKMLMLSEVITQKYSLPGGYIDDGNTAPEAAVREVLEETGVDVEVVELLQYRSRAAVYACVATSPIPVSNFRDHNGFMIVASWFSKHFATEVERVYLLDPRQLDISNYRYPEDVNLLPKWLARTPESQIQYYDSLTHQLSMLHRIELPFVINFQAVTENWPHWLQAGFDGVMFIANQPGELWVLLCLGLLVAVSCRTSVLLECLLFSLVMLVASSTLKYWFASPRPFFVLPELQRIEAYGFGFPSSHTMTATMVLGGAWYGLNRLTKGRYKRVLMASMLMLILAQGMVRVWYGVQFISDTVLSIMLGLVIVSAWAVWREMNPDSLQRCMTSKTFWLCMTFAVGVGASYTLDPLHAYAFSAMLGVMVAMETAVRFDQPAPETLKGRILALLMLGGGAAVIWCGTEELAAVQTVSLIVLGINAFGCFLMSLWFVAGASWVRGKCR